VADLGSDFSGILDIDPALTVVSGPRCLAEALARRLTTPKGRLLGDPDYGHDLRQYLNAAIVDTAQIANAIEIECLKDERVQGVTASVTFDAATQTITANIIVKISDAESFPFTLAVGEASAAITLLEAA
jgi:hypothetical protein